MKNLTVTVTSANQVFTWIEKNGGDAGNDWHPFYNSAENPTHIYRVEMKDGSPVDFNAPSEEIALKVWNETF